MRASYLEKYYMLSTLQNPRSAEYVTIISSVFTEVFNRLDNVDPNDLNKVLSRKGRQSCAAVVTFFELDETRVDSYRDKEIAF